MHPIQNLGLFLESVSGSLGEQASVRIYMCPITARRSRIFSATATTTTTSAAHTATTTTTTTKTTTIALLLLLLLLLPPLPMGPCTQTVLCIYIYI